ncbi:hypothetical protein L7F22_010677 [Adiantum nelumboides]|nr:hypothetical protein [Adiantum nelumboides]
MRSKSKSQVREPALGKNIRVLVAKMQRIIDQIQNCSYEEALVSPEFMSYRACHPVAQPVLSTAANASTNLGLNRSDSFVSKAGVSNSTYPRRFRPRAQGRGYPISCGSLREQSFSTLLHHLSLKPLAGLPVPMHLTPPLKPALVALPVGALSAGLLEHLVEYVSA